MDFSPITYLLDFSTPDFTKLEDPAITLHLMEAIAAQCHFQVVNRSFKKFMPQGLTAMLLLAESHISIHTWPEKELFCMDIFTCKGPLQISNIVHHLQEEVLGLVLINVQEIKRSSYAGPAPAMAHTNSSSAYL